MITDTLLRNPFFTLHLPLASCHLLKALLHKACASSVPGEKSINYLTVSGCPVPSPSSVVYTVEEKSGSCSVSHRQVFSRTREMELNCFQSEDIIAE